MTRCHGTVVPLGSAASAYPTILAWSPSPAIRAIWPYVARRPDGTRRTTAYTRAYVESARPLLLWPAFDAPRLIAGSRKDLHRRIRPTLASRKRRPSAYEARDGHPGGDHRPDDGERRKQRNAKREENSADRHGGDGESDRLAAGQPPSTQIDDANVHARKMPEGPRGGNRLSRNRSTSHFLGRHSVQRGSRNVEHSQHQIHLPTMVHLVLDHRSQPLPCWERDTRRRRAPLLERRIGERCKDRDGFPMHPVEVGDDAVMAARELRGVSRIPARSAGDVLREHPPLGRGEMPHEVAKGVPSRRVRPLDALGRYALHDAPRPSPDALEILEKLAHGGDVHGGISSRCRARGARANRPSTDTRSSRSSPGRPGSRRSGSRIHSSRAPTTRSDRNCARPRAARGGA